MSPGKSYMVGERGPELFTPSTGGTITPTENSVGGGAPVINLTNVNVTSEDEVFAALNSSRGEQIILNKIRRNKKAVRQTVNEA